MIDLDIPCGHTLNLRVDSWSPWSLNLSYPCRVWPSWNIMELNKWICTRWRLMPDPEIHNKNVLASVLETLELETLFSIFICQYKIPYKISNFPISDWFYSILCTPLYWLNFVHLTLYKLKIKIISIKPSNITRSTGSSKTCG